MSDLAVKLSEYLRKKKLSLVTAESCTGGMIAAVMTDLAGSSDVFERGFVTYSNESKQELLGVPIKMIKTYGAVSAECAKAMAEGALKNSHADIAVSVTGIAGPGGGSAEKPVGLVYIGTAKRGKAPRADKFIFNGNRHTVRALTRDQALTLLMNML